MPQPDQRCRLGPTDIEVSALTLGGTPFGDMYEAVPDEVAVATVRTAFNGGVRSFDTAPLYGVGKSERRLGLGIDGLDRQQLTVCTKVGRVLQDDDGTIAPTFEYSPEAIHTSLAGSRTRLDIDRFDVVHVHDPDRFIDAALAGAFPTLRDLQRQGVVGAVSAGMNNNQPLARFIREGAVDCVMIAGRFSLLDHSAIDELLPVAWERGVSVLVAGVFNSGVLADPDAPAHLVNYGYSTPSPEIMQRVAALRSACEHHGVSLRAAALQFPFLHPAVASVVVGCRNPSEVEQNLIDIACSIPSQLWDDLVGQRLISAQVVRSVDGRS